MAWDTNDIILINVRQDYLEQSLTNTLFYKVIEITAGLITEAVLDALAKFIVDSLTQIQQNVLTHIEQVFDNLTDGVSQYVSTYFKVGDGSDPDILASFMAIGMKKAVATRVTRPGSIRIAGIGETAASGNSLTGAAATLAVEIGVDLASLTIIDDLGGNIAVFQPIVVGRNVDGSFNLAAINDITSMAFPTLTTQNSRKPGR